MSRIPSNVNTKTKREPPKISRSESTTKRATVTKSLTTTSNLTKKPPAKAADEKDKSRVAIAKTSTRPTVVSKPRTQPAASSTSTKQQTATATRKSTEQKNVNQSQRIATKVASSSNQKQPLRAKHTAEIQEAVRKNAIVKTTTTVAKANAVLDTPHNVTVSSPPARRKNDEHLKEETSQREPPVVKLSRKGSRVLAPDEIVVLKRESAKKRSEEQIRRESTAQLEQPTSLPVKEPVAFEVTFDEQEQKNKERARSAKPVESNEIRERSRSRVKPKKEDKNEEETNYSDDFDSYESDFETGSSPASSQETDEDSAAGSETPSEEEEDNESGNDESESGNEDDHDNSESEENSSKHEDVNRKDIDETEDESELTQDPITVLQRDKERKLDSGHYEMNSRRNPKLADLASQSTQHLVDSFEAFSLNTSDQLDSGISGYGPSTLNNSNSTHSGNFQVFYGGYKDFNTKPILNKRSNDLMSKIQFDTLNFKLFDLKPISYDVFMQTFGKLNASQSSTQTQDNLMEVEQQTDVFETRSMWTQHPAQYDLQMVQHLHQEGNYKSVFAQNCCGEFSDSNDVRFNNECDLEQSLVQLRELNTERYSRQLQNHVKTQRKPINYESLNAFLLKSSLVINQIIASDSNKAQSDITSSDLGNLERITDSCYLLETNFLNTLKVVKIYSNPKHNLIVTVHESLPETDVYKSDFSQILMVWCLGVNDKPTRLLTTWSHVARVEISYDSCDIIVAALRDGSVALWDLRETYSFCSKLDGSLTHFAATQSIVPSWGGGRGKAEILMDLGSCLDVRSFRSQPNMWNLPSSKGSYNKTQFVSLHDSGLLTVWTLVETSEPTLNLLALNKTDKSKHPTKLQSKFGYSSPWARVKLIQSSILYLKDHLETKNLQAQTRFDKTKTLFQKNIYSDEALKELNKNSGDFGQQGLRFTSIECGSETIYICTNRNFILMCSKTLKPGRFRRIILNESRFLFPTALRVLTNENFLAVGLSNGAVMILNCALNKQFKAKKSAEKCKTPGTPFPDLDGKDAAVDMDSITGKSCAIQNIVLNSQKSYDSMDFNSNNHNEYRPDTAAIVALIDSDRKPFELRVYDQQVILAGSVLRRNLIQTLDLSSDGWRLFALSNGRIRVYDFYLDQEIGSEEEATDAGKVLDIGCGKTNQNEMNLMVLKKDSQVEVYSLKK